MKVAGRLAIGKALGETEVAVVSRAAAKAEDLKIWSPSWLAGTALPIVGRQNSKRFNRTQR
jgi:hypothetical protein